MNPEGIPKLIEQLESRSSTAIVTNFYAIPDLTQNLAVYLRALCDLPYSGHLVLGEAPGYRGCALTGIPFTSQRILATSPHPFLSELRKSITVSGNMTEATATIVWDHLLGCQTLPGMWNVFPFHPHCANFKSSNRKPTTAEVADGYSFLKLILDILTPAVIIAVGRTAASAMNAWFPAVSVATARHPSFGGKKEYVAQVRAAGIS
jgi:hypothetical protein